MAPPDRPTRDRGGRRPRPRDRLPRLGLDLPRDPLRDRDAARVHHGGAALPARRRHPLRLGAGNRHAAAGRANVAPGGADRAAPAARRQRRRGLGRAPHPLRRRGPAGRGRAGLDRAAGARHLGRSPRRAPRRRSVSPRAWSASPSWSSIRPAGSTRPPIDLLGAIAVVLAALSWALGSLVATRADLPRSAALSTGMQMLVGGTALLVGGRARRRVGRDRLRRPSRPARSQPSATWSSRARSSLSAPTPTCCATCVRPWSRPTLSSTRWSRCCSGGWSRPSR